MVMKHLMAFESYSSVGEYADTVFDFLKPYELFPSQVRHLRSAYSDRIVSAYEVGRYPRELAEEIARELELEKDGYPVYFKPSSKWQTSYYR